MRNIFADIANVARAHPILRLKIISMGKKYEDRQMK